MQEKSVRSYPTLDISLNTGLWELCSVICLLTTHIFWSLAWHYWYFIKQAHKAFDISLFVWDYEINS